MDLGELDQDAPYVYIECVQTIFPVNGKATVIYQPGFDLSGARTARAQIIASAGIDILIFDVSSNLWRWRPADTSGRGSLVKVRVRAIAEGGEANRAVTELLAKELGVPKRAVRVLSGTTSRLKQVAVDGNPDLLGAALRKLTANLNKSKAVGKRFIRTRLQPGGSAAEPDGPGTP